MVTLICTCHLLHACIIGRRVEFEDTKGDSESVNRKEGETTQWPTEKGQ